MPFSDCGPWSQDRWTQFFEKELRPRVELHGYECIRSSGDRGNILKDIVQFLASAHVVLADLTGLNSNVLYELGIRHSLSRRTLMITQDDLNGLPFDLKHYGCRKYSMTDPRGRLEFEAMLDTLFEGVDHNPNKDDSPVADFSTIESRTEQERERERVQRLLEALYSDLDMEDFMFRPQGNGESTLLDEDGEWNPFVVAGLIPSPASLAIRAEGLTNNINFLSALKLHDQILETARGMALTANIPSESWASHHARDIRGMNMLPRHHLELILEAIEQGHDPEDVTVPDWATESESWFERLDERDRESNAQSAR